MIDEEEREGKSDQLNSLGWVRPGVPTMRSRGQSGGPEGPKQPRTGLNHQDPPFPKHGKPCTTRRGAEHNPTRLRAVMAPLTSTYTVPPVGQ